MSNPLWPESHYQPYQPPIPPEYPEPDHTLWRWVIGVVVALLTLLAIGVGISFLVQAKSGPSHSQQVVSWRDDAKDDMSKLATDLILMGNSAKAQDIPAMRNACSLVASDIAPVQKKLPTPDESLTKSLTAFLDDTHKGALACSNLSNYTDAKVAATFFDSALKHLDEAADIIDKAQAEVVQK